MNAKLALLTALLTALLAACAATPENCGPKPGEPVPDTQLCANQARGGT